MLVVLEKDLQLVATITSTVYEAGFEVEAPNHRYTALIPAALYGYFITLYKHRAC